MSRKDRDESDDQLQLENLRIELQGRRQVPDPRKVGDVIHDLAARRGYFQSLSADKLATAWRSAVGEELAEHTRAGNIRRGTIEVFVADSSLVQELTFQKRELLRRLHAAAPNFKLRDIKFRVGGFS